MHDQQQQPQKPLLQEWAQNTNIILGIIQIYCMIFSVFVKKPGSWGERFASWRMMASWVLLFLFGPLFYPREDHRPLLLLFLASTVLLLIHRVAGIWRRSRGYRCHSLYPGNSWLGTDARDVVLVFFCGILSLLFNQPLAAYLLIGSVCMWIIAAWQRAAHAAKRRAIADAQFESEVMMDGEQP
jgi:hypothetical protein